MTTLGSRSVRERVVSRRSLVTLCCCALCAEGRVSIARQCPGARVFPCPPYLKHHDVTASGRQGLGQGKDHVLVACQWRHVGEILRHCLTRDSHAVAMHKASVQQHFHNHGQAANAVQLDDVVLAVRREERRACIVSQPNEYECEMRALGSREGRRGDRDARERGEPKRFEVSFPYLALRRQVANEWHLLRNAVKVLNGEWHLNGSSSDEWTSRKLIPYIRACSFLKRYFSVSLYVCMCTDLSVSISLCSYL